MRVFAHRAAVMRHRAELYIKAAIQIPDGKCPRASSRFATEARKREKGGAPVALAYRAVMSKKQSGWLRKKGIEWFSAR